MGQVMDIGNVNRVDLNAPVVANVEDPGLPYRDVVFAIRELNQSELLGNRRELRWRREPNGRVVIELVDSETGEVLGEVPPGEIVQMAKQLHREQEKEEQ